VRATGAIRTAPEDIILTARNPERLEHAARELGALSTAAFDATDTDRLEQFFQELPAPIDHVIVTAARPHYQPLAEMDFARARRSLDEHLILPCTSPAWQPARSGRAGRCCSSAAPAPVDRRSD
jgi:short-subunit dehydrogenase